MTISTFGMSIFEGGQVHLPCKAMFCKTDCSLTLLHSERPKLYTIEQCPSLKVDKSFCLVRQCFAKLTAP